MTDRYVIVLRSGFACCDDIKARSDFRLRQLEAASNPYMRPAYRIRVKPRAAGQKRLMVISPVAS